MMRSIREIRNCLTIAVALLASGGCLKSTKPAEMVDRRPLILDDAMQARQWKKTVARFQNGETPATPTGFIFANRPNAPHWQQAISGSPLFVANVFAMPVGYLFTPPWQRVIYPGGVIEPSYIGNPPVK